MSARILGGKMTSSSTTECFLKLAENSNSDFVSYGFMSNYTTGDVLFIIIISFVCLLVITTVCFFAQIIKDNQKVYLYKKTTNSNNHK